MLVNSKDTPSASEPEGPHRDDELVKQEMLVQYLQDAYSFSQKVTEAIGIISKMMYENTSTGKPGSSDRTGRGAEKQFCRLVVTDAHAFLIAIFLRFYCSCV